LPLNDLNDTYSVRIFWDDNGWYLRDAGSNQNLFSFDLPPELYLRYADAQGLTRAAALHLKEDLFSEIQALTVQNGHPRRIRFMLDGDWIGDLRREAEHRVATRPEPRTRVRE
jgi:hypothetical protein